MPLECAHASTCLPDYWGGHTTITQLKRDLLSELANGPVCGSEAPEEDDEQWYRKARAAINRIRTATPRKRLVFPDLPEHDDDDGDSVYTYFVFQEL